jgi:hypothetical protein
MRRASAWVWPSRARLGWRSGRLARLVGSAPEGVYDLSEPRDAALSAARLAVPNAPEQTLDRVNAHGLGPHLAGTSVDGTSAACAACRSRVAVWNGSRVGGGVTPAPATMGGRPGQPSVGAVASVPSTRPAPRSAKRGTPWGPPPRRNTARTPGSSSFCTTPLRSRFPSPRRAGSASQGSTPPSARR